MEQAMPYFSPAKTPSPNTEGTVKPSEHICTQNADPEGVESERKDGDSCPASPLSVGSPETVRETERCTSDTMPPLSPAATELEDVEAIYILVQCAGKSEEICTYPLERVSVLLEESCRIFGKKDPLKMKLIYKGDEMDREKMLCDYSMKGSMTLQLIRSS